jgi:hypothetical protein
MEQIKKHVNRIVFALVLCTIVQWHVGCSKANGGPEGGDGDTPQAGYLTGTVKDRTGKPLKGVRILVDHSIFFNANVSTQTDAEGKYKVKVPVGSWYAFAINEVTYRGDRFSFYLHPENPAGFGGEGGVRNFVWNLSGTMPQPLSGNYGGLVTLDNFPGVYIETSEIDFVFRPEGPLVDGTEGQEIRCRAENGYSIKDLPIGHYKLTATYEGTPVKFRPWNSEEEFTAEWDLYFEPRIEGQCDNCMMLEYYWEPER